MSILKSKYEGKSVKNLTTRVPLTIFKKIYTFKYLCPYVGRHIVFVLSVCPSVTKYCMCNLHACFLSTNEKAVKHENVHTIQHTSNSYTTTQSKMY